MWHKKLSNILFSLQSKQASHYASLAKHYCTDLQTRKVSSPPSAKTKIATDQASTQGLLNIPV